MASRLPWSHFHVAPDGRIVGFSVDTCENCDKQVQSPNAIGLGETKKRLLSLGLVEVPVRLPEEFYSEELGHCVCELCA